MILKNLVRQSVYRSVCSTVFLVPSALRETIKCKLTKEIEPSSAADPMRGSKMTKHFLTNLMP